MNMNRMEWMNAIEYAWMNESMNMNRMDWMHEWKIQCTYYYVMLSIKIIEWQYRMNMNMNRMEWMHEF